MHLQRVGTRMSAGLVVTDAVSVQDARSGSGGGVTAWHCRAVIQQCCMSLSTACKKGSRTTAAALIATLGETPFVLTGGDAQLASISSESGGPAEVAVQLPAFVKPRDLCFDLENNIDLGPNARAVPSYLESARVVLALLGVPSAFDKPKGAPSVRVSAAPPSNGLEAWVRAQFNKPQLADVRDRRSTSFRPTFRLIFGLCVDTGSLCLDRWQHDLCPSVSPRCKHTGNPPFLLVTYKGLYLT